MNQPQRKIIYVNYPKYVQKYRFVNHS